MHTDIMGRKTIKEYKQAKAIIEKIIAECSALHRVAVEDWTHGKPEKVWVDTDGHICIEYESGRWWHYGSNGEWW